MPDDAVPKRAISKKGRSDFIKIFHALKQFPGGLWVRELARRTKLHMEVVRRIILKHPDVFQNYADFTNYNINLKIIKLRNPDMTEKAVDQYFRLKAS